MEGPVRRARRRGHPPAPTGAERKKPFAVLLADDFITDQYPGVTSDLINAYHLDGKSQLSVMEVGGPEISNYGVVMPDIDGTGIIGLIEKQDGPFNILNYQQ